MGELVERVSDNLESMISETGATDEDITDTSMLMPVWKEKCITLQTKFRIINTNVKSALLYTIQKLGDTD